MDLFLLLDGVSFVDLLLLPRRRFFCGSFLLFVFVFAML